MPKLKKEEAGSFSKFERQKMQRLYTQSGAAYGSVRNLVKAINLSVSKVRQFLPSKPSYTKFTLATRQFKRIGAIARFRNEMWCIDLAYVDKIAKVNNGVKYLLVRQDQFDRTVDSKGMKTKDSKETVCAFLTMITKKNRPRYRLSAVNFIRKSWSKSFNNGIVSTRVGFNSICTILSRQYIELFYKIFFNRATESGRSMGGCNFRKILTIKVAECHAGKIYVFWQKNSKLSEFYYLEPGLYLSLTDSVEAMIFLIQERHNHSENCITVKVSRRTQKVEIYLANERSGLAFFSMDLGHIFGNNVGNEFGVMLRGTGPTNQNLLTTLSAYTLSWYTRTWLSTISSATRRLHWCVAFFLFPSSRLETL